MTIQEQFVTYEIALKLKELGFDEECFGFYNHNGMLFYQCIAKQYDGYIDITKVNFEIYKEDIGAPLWQQVLQWFIEKYKLHIVINPYNDEELSQILYYFEITDKDFNVIGDYTYYHSHRECLDIAISEAIILTIEENSTNIASTTEM